MGLKSKKRVATPADLSGVKLRMPPGDAWLMLGRSIGANPTPMAYAETYTGLQTGAIDGQDNPLPNVQNMKFYEVMGQIVLTSHLIGFDLLAVNMKTCQQPPFSPLQTGQRWPRLTAPQQRQQPHQRQSRHQQTTRRRTG